MNVIVSCSPSAQKRIRQEATIHLVIAIFVTGGLCTIFDLVGLFLYVPSWRTLKRSRRMPLTTEVRAQIKMERS